MDPKIQVSEVSFAYPQRLALSNLSLTVDSGEFLGILGPNSSGKSTLLKLMGRELKPSVGQIQLGEKHLQDWALQDLARAVTVVSSEEHFTFPFTVEQIVLMGRIPYIKRGRKESAEDRDAVDAAMQATDVIALRQRSIHELSSGERQRVLLARALAQEPQVLLLDEPTVHLDIGHAWGFFELLQRLHARRDLTVICALHDLALAATFCSRLVMMRQGQLHSQGSPQEILNEDTLREVFGITLPSGWARLVPTARVNLNIK
jgi:iron complex transport system ATP-binding protein